MLHFVSFFHRFLSCHNSFFIILNTIFFIHTAIWIKSYPLERLIFYFRNFLPSFSCFLTFYVAFLFLFLFFPPSFLSLHFRHQDSSSLPKRRSSSVVAEISFSNVEIFLSPNSITVGRNLASHSLCRGKDRKSDRMFTRHWSGTDDVHGSTLNRKEIPRNVYGSLDSRQELTLELVTTGDWPWNRCYSR